MKIGITGADGFLGFHARAYLYALKEHEIRLATKDTFFLPERLDEFVNSVDIIWHFAGVNRGNEIEVERGNVLIANTLISSLKRKNVKPILIYANSFHAMHNTSYGRGKKEAALIFKQWADESKSVFIDLILPHVFGEFVKPFYNSAVATFCYQLTINESPKIIQDAELELIHAQDVIKQVNCLMQVTQSQPIKIPGARLRVSNVLEILKKMLMSYRQNIIPAFTSLFELQLFNTLRSYLFPKHYPVFVEKKVDERGTLFEAVKSKHEGQTFISTSKPGVIRGEHFHLNKIERFLVLSGKAEIKLRKLFSNQIETFEVSGSKPCYVDIPTFHTHCIKNVGDLDLVTLFWSNELFDPNFPDTYAERVLV